MTINIPLYAQNVTFDITEDTTSKIKNKTLNF